MLYVVVIVYQFAIAAAPQACCVALVYVFSGAIRTGTFVDFVFFRSCLRSCRVYGRVRTYTHRDSVVRVLPEVGEENNEREHVHDERITHPRREWTVDIETNAAHY